MRRTLNLIPYDDRWPARFRDEAKRLRSSIGAFADAIEHVGSTAVAGLMGKAVLDIAVAVGSFDAADSCIAPLESLGYEYRGMNGDDPRRRYYVRDEAGRRVVQVHLYVLPARGYVEQLAFRDALRADPALVAAYADEKLRVAEAVGWDKAAYALEKGAFVERVLERLRREGKLRDVDDA